MKYDDDFWSKYALDDSSYNAELAKYISNLATSMKAQSVLEIGCSTGNDLKGFAEDFKVHGIDLNDTALDKARTKLGTFNFQKGSIADLSFEDSSFDLVFTRGVLIHIPTKDLDNVLKEFVRISKKWILNFEYFGEDGKMIKWKRGDDLLWYRNMKERWKNFDVNIINEIDIPKEIDPGKMKLTLVTKNH